MPEPDAPGAQNASEPVHADARTGPLACLLPALAGVGAGLVEIAIGSGGPLVVGGVFVALGAAHLAWAVWLLRGDRVRMPAVAITVAVAVILCWPLLLMLSSVMPGLEPMIRPLPIGVAAALNAGIAVLLIMGRRMSEHLGRPSTGRWFAWLFGTAALVAMLVTPALAAAPPGDYARPHGEQRPAVEPDHGH
ncbi:hypothetical protein [Salinibacterium sp. ZJ454]|uniref:hypothetical protein n=1 Tax=Salinibacterium sp. ZJ454 TaxID=2708339 RepID=UPI00141E7883|nr:hypothetical protein [Salinibacterium sp. ZJ454]